LPRESRTWQFLTSAERQANLVVIGTRGEHFFYDLFIGSTVEKVLQRMTLPLLIVTTVAPLGLMEHGPRLL
jgi:nucleotide-binding universal stress UspA family protein